jgi:predicted nuclease with TOPRIM domain
MGDSTGSGISYHKMYMDLKTETIINTMKMEEKIRNLEAQLAEKQRNAPNTGALQSQLASKNRELAEKNRTIREQQGKLAFQEKELEKLQQQNNDVEDNFKVLSATFAYLHTTISNPALFEEALQHAEKQLQSKYHQDDVEDEMREVCDVIDAEADAHLAAQLHEECSVQEYADTVY